MFGKKIIFLCLFVAYIRTFLAFSGFPETFNMRRCTVAIQMCGSGMENNRVPLSTQRIQKMQEIVEENEDNLRANDAVCIIKYCFEDFTDIRRVMPLKRLATIIQSSDHSLGVHELAEAISGLADLSSDEPEVRFLLASLTKRLSEYDDGDFRASDISKCLTGLQCMDAQHPEVLDLLRLCTTKLKNCPLQLSSLDIANAIYGMQRMTANDKVVRDLLAVLGDQLSACKDNISSRALNLYGYGMQHMSCEYPEVRDFLMVLTIKVANSRTDFSGQALSNGLFLMKNMKSHHPEVISWVELMNKCLSESKRALKSYMVARALLGMQGLSSEVPAVRALASTFAKKVLKGVVDMEDELSAADMGKAFLGLRSMKSVHPEVRRLLGALVFKSILSNKSITAKTVGLALIGLDQLDRSTPEVQYTLQMFRRKVGKSTKFNFQERGMALYGLEGCDIGNPDAVFEALGVQQLRQRLFLTPAAAAAAAAVADLSLTDALIDAEDVDA